MTVAGWGVQGLRLPTFFQAPRFGFNGGPVVPVLRQQKHLWSRHWNEAKRGSRDISWERPTRWAIIPLLRGWKNLSETYWFIRPFIGAIYYPCHSMCCTRFGAQLVQTPRVWWVDGKLGKLSFLCPGGPGNAIRHTLRGNDQPWWHLTLSGMIKG